MTHDTASHDTAAHAGNGHGHEQGDADHGMAHVMPPSILIGTFVALIGLTVLTVVSSYFPLGSAELVVAMGIATVKAALVAVYFMHLRYDKPLNAMLFVFSLFFVALFLGATLIDTEQYQPEIEAASTP